MRNDELKQFITETIKDRDSLCAEHGGKINKIQNDIQEIKIELTKIVTAYKVFIAIGSAVGVVIGACVEYFTRK